MSCSRPDLFGPTSTYSISQEGPMNGTPSSSRERLWLPLRTPEIAQFQKPDKAVLHCDLRVRWKIASSDLRFQAAMSQPETSLSESFSGKNSGDLALVMPKCQQLRNHYDTEQMAFWKEKPVDFHPGVAEHVWILSNRLLHHWSADIIAEFYSGLSVWGLNVFLILLAIAMARCWSAESMMHVSLYLVISLQRHEWQRLVVQVPTEHSRNSPSRFVIGKTLDSPEEQNHHKM